MLVLVSIHTILDAPCVRRNWPIRLLEFSEVNDEVDKSAVLEIVC